MPSWSDSILQALYDAIHAVALTAAGATSLMHEAKVDVVTVPNLSEHLSSAGTTAQLSARFAYAAAMRGSHGNKRFASWTSPSEHRR